MREVDQEIIFKPPLPNPNQTLVYLRDSLTRTTALSRLLLQQPSSEAWERFRAEKRIYLDYLHKFDQAIMGSKNGHQAALDNSLASSYNQQWIEK